MITCHGHDLIPYGQPMYCNFHSSSFALQVLLIHNFLEEVREKFFNSTLEERELSLPSVNEYFKSKILDKE